MFLCLSFVVHTVYQFIFYLSYSYFYAVMMGTAAGIIMWKNSVKAHALFGYGDKKSVQKPEDVVWDDVRKDIVGLLEMEVDDDIDSLGPILVRLAWHACGTYHQYQKVQF